MISIETRGADVPEMCPTGGEGVWTVRAELVKEFKEPGEILRSWLTREQMHLLHWIHQFELIFISNHKNPLLVSWLLALVLQLRFRSPVEEPQRRGGGSGAKYGGKGEATEGKHAAGNIVRREI